MLFAAIAVAVVPGIAPDPLFATIVGMTSMAVAIVGGPLTMSFLAMETTGDLPITLAVLLLQSYPRSPSASCLATRSLPGAAALAG
jgi:H+/Cl- antiporter ClcA